MEIAAKTLVKLALLPGSKGAESFDFDMKRAFEWLSEERNEVKYFQFFREHNCLFIYFEFLTGEKACCCASFA